MKSRFTSVIVAALAAMISASPAQAGGLKQVAEISIPGDPITDIGIMDIDQTMGLGYLADKTNKSVVVFDTKADKFVSRIPGFVGRLKDGEVQSRLKQVFFDRAFDRMLWQAIKDGMQN